MCESEVFMCEGAFRYQEFKILETRGSSEWNEEDQSTGYKSTHLISNRTTLIRAFWICARRASKQVL